MRPTPNEIDWSTIGTHIYQRPERIPQAFRDLNASDPEVREYARNFLLGHGQDFGSYYDTTPLIVGFLLDILGDPDTPDRSEIMMALGGPFWGMLTSWGTIAMKRIQVAIYAMAKERRGILITLLSDAEVPVRKGAAMLLGYLTEDRHELVSILLNHAARETDAEVGSELCQSVKRLLADSMGWKDFVRLDPIPMFYDLIFRHPLMEVRVAAAQAAVEIQHAHHSMRQYASLWQEITRLLLDTFLVQTQHVRLPDAYDDIATVAPLLSDLSRLAPEPLLAAVTRPDISAEQAHLLARAIMICACIPGDRIAVYWQEISLSLVPWHDERVFRYRPQSLIHERSPFRCDLIQALVDTPRVWDIPTTLFSAWFSMPDSREALAMWLTQHTAER
ncbi:hypothetical protein [Herpetosiphon sp. NSE202]|uniref:hypothetical protein n=1 Tax=Herpetosiphon sp. NSE202 TaxID=3351349 RepID=UPI003632FF9F